MTRMATSFLKIAQRDRKGEYNNGKKRKGGRSHNQCRRIAK